MFLRLLSLVLLVSAVHAHGAEIPGLNAKIYKLKSFTKILRGVRTESRIGRQQFCGEQLTPKQRVREGKEVLDLSPSLGFEWRNIDDHSETIEGCRMPVLQTVESGRGVSRLVLLNQEVCENAKAPRNALREILHLNGDEIILESADPYDEGKEGFVCVWTAVR